MKSEQVPRLLAHSNSAPRFHTWGRSTWFKPGILLPASAPTASIHLWRVPRRMNLHCGKKKSELHASHDRPCKSECLKYIISLPPAIPPLIFPPPQPQSRFSSSAPCHAPHHIGQALIRESPQSFKACGSEPAFCMLG